MVVRERAAVAVVWVVAVAAEVEEEAAADEDGIGEVACEEALEEEVTAEDEDATEDLNSALRFKGRLTKHPGLMSAQKSWRSTEWW